MVFTTSQAMRLYGCVLVLAVLTFTSSSAIPKPDKEKEHKERTKEKHLSTEEHEKDGEHNTDYDHEAFLGQESKTFDQLSPEESRERLGFIVDKIDKDHDGLVTEEELKSWIQYVQKRYVLVDTDRTWKDHEPDADGKLQWTSYKKRTYGYPDDPEDKDSPTHEYREMIARDERRWKKADKDGDGKLSHDEFVDFLHPEDAEHMREIVVLETLEDIDKDKDGFISLEEYIGDMWREKQEGEEEPDWVKSEREQFRDYRDKNKDGKMDSREVQDWIIPTDYDHSLAEAKHLMYESDADKDGKLTREEILDKYDLFVGSQATDFGEALTKHDEF
ncbi:calumenin-B-like isoform X2 [Gigantopelta aegis]|uniref:calumenin-B-like isoform X2 n=1 Tax=Gigantopelta aegis TaxID=1735272 RepID=UPI001B889A5C|nr:calumenin-B-like isoform X2 [Gigantopelta aegis]